MRMPAQPRYEDFVPRFLRSLFAPGDRVVLVSLKPGGAIANEPFARDETFGVRNISNRHHFIVCLNRRPVRHADCVY